MADPFIIALARMEGRIVVTNELYERDRKKKEPGIPDVCDKYNLPHRSLEGFIQQEGLDS
jgi:hypothetical protein